jgi:hypothetical protein
VSAVDHEDYELLMAIRDLTIQDIAEADARGEEYVLDPQGRHADRQSLSIFALTHAASMLGLSTDLEVNEHRKEVERVAGIFIQGFQFGAQFKEARTPLRARTARRNARSGDPRKRAKA